MYKYNLKYVLTSNICHARMRAHWPQSIQVDFWRSDGQRIEHLNACQMLVDAQNQLLVAITVDLRLKQIMQHVECTR